MEIQLSQRPSQPRRFVYRDAEPDHPYSHPLRRATDRRRQPYVIEARPPQHAMLLQFRIYPDGD